MKILGDEALREHVIETLTARGNRIRRDEILILCPYHNDSNPSLGVHIGYKITPGSFHCWSCGASGGWPKLAKTLGIEDEWTNAAAFGSGKSVHIQVDDPFQVLDKTMKRAPIVSSIVPLTLHGTEPLPANFNWRNLGRTFLEKYGAKYWWQRDVGRDIEMEWLYFPLNMSAQYKGYTICALRPNKPKYLTYANTTEVLFLYDSVPEKQPLILVEGHYDCLRLHAEGLPALGIFGVENWSPQKREYVIAKQPTKILILFDADEAGQRAAQEVFLDLRSGSEVDIYYLPQIEGERLDPGNMPQEFVHDVYNRLGITGPIV